MNPVERAKTLLVQDSSYELLDRSNNYEEKPPVSYNPSNVFNRVRSFVTRSGQAHVYANPQPQPGRPSANVVHRLTGWRYGVFLCILGLGICLACEVVFLVLASVKGSGVLYSGDCDAVQKHNIALLVPLNIIGVVVVGVCNYVMQVVSAPSRKAIDKAHAKGVSLRIGQSSPHNLRYLKSWQQAVWVVLGITVIPALWALNAVIEPNLQANNYGVTVVGFGYIEDFNYETCYNITTGPASRMSSGYQTAICDLQNGALSKNSSFVVLSNADCINALGTSNGIQNKYSNVLIVTSNDTYPWAGVQSMDPTEVAPGVSVDVSNAFVDLAQPYGANMTYMTAGQSGQDHGIYLDQYSLIWNLPSLRASFNSFDYGRWTLANLKKYNFNDESILAYHNKFDSTVWMCNTAEVANAETCSYKDVLRRASNWFVTPENFKVDHCVAQVAEQEHCNLALSGKVLAGLIALDVVRLVCVSIVLYTALYTGKSRPEDEPLVTIGDGVLSFLGTPDPSTVSRCLLSLPELRNLRNSSSKQYSTRNPTGPQPIPLPWKAKSYFALSLPSRTRTIITSIILILSVSFSVAILGYTSTLAASASSGRNHPTSTILSLGIGSLSHIIPDEILLNGKISVLDHGVPSDLLLNLPQILFAVLYLVLNQYLTILVQGHEMSIFSTTNQSARLPVLRVSNPLPSSLQYSTTWLSLPFIYSISLNIIFFLIHLFLSRAIFVVPINVWSYGTYRDTQRDLTGLGASPIAISIVLVLTLACILLVATMGLRRLNKVVPVVGGDSLAISAICHDAGGKDAAGVEVGLEGAGEKEVRWGVIEDVKMTDMEGLEHGEAVGHCSLTGREQIRRPVEGRLYA